MESAYENIVNNKEAEWKIEMPSGAFPYNCVRGENCFTLSVKWCARDSFLTFQELLIFWDWHQKGKNTCICVYLRVYIRIICTYNSLFWLWYLSHITFKAFYMVWTCVMGTASSVGSLVSGPPVYTPFNGKIAVSNKKFCMFFQFLHARRRNTGIMVLIPKKNCQKHWKCEGKNRNFTLPKCLKSIP